LRRCPKILLPILWWPTAIGINAMHQLGIDSLAIIVARGPCGFVCPCIFPLLLMLAKVLYIRLAEFCKLFIELHHYFGPLPD
jgi:hypothetical protein